MLFQLLCLEKGEGEGRENERKKRRRWREGRSKAATVAASQGAERGRFQS